MAAKENAPQVAALLLAAKENAPQVAALLLAAGVDPNVAAPGLRNPLHAAAYSGATDTVQVLLAAGADPNVAQRGGHTPLYDAVWGGESAVMAMLLAGGGDPNVRDDAGLTPLHFAAIDNKRQMATMLLEAGETLIVEMTRDGLPCMVSLRSTCPAFRGWQLYCWRREPIPRPVRTKAKRLCSWPSATETQTWWHSYRLTEASDIVLPSLGSTMTQH